jgi:cytochrome c oxidase assembly protein subunit 19
MVLAARGLAPSPPVKGSFPLDHYGDCKKNMKLYMKCIAEAKGDVSICKHLSKAYLKCRMDK